MTPAAWRARGAALLIAGAVLPGMVAPTSVQAFEKAFRGPTQVNGVSQFPIYHDLGVKIYQLTVGWDQVAPSRPVDPANPADPAYHWPPDVDYAIGEAGRYGMRVLVQLIGAPRWANGDMPWQWAPKHPSDYATFAAAASRRYPRVREWLIWGEPSRGQNFQPLIGEKSSRRLTPSQAMAPRLYARLLDAAYGSLKRASPRNLIIGGNTLTGGDISPLNWMRYMRLPNGRHPRLDLYGHNPFSFRNPDLRDPPSRLCFGRRSGRCFGDMADIVRVAKGVDRYVAPRQHIPLFLSEYTIPTARDAEFNFWVSRPTQARWIKNALRIGRRFRRIVGLGWVHLKDERGLNGGLLDSRGRKKPGYGAFKRG